MLAPFLSFGPDDDVWTQSEQNNVDSDTVVNKSLDVGEFISDAKISGFFLQQELVSMLPVKLLLHLVQAEVRKTLIKDADNNVQKNVSNTTNITNPNVTPCHLRFLDMCSAPGSKTCQLLDGLEMMKQDFTSSTSEQNNSDINLEYSVVANDLELSRADQVYRRAILSVPQACSNLIVTAGDAGHEDFFTTESHDDSKKSENHSNTSLFDYILLDVPCSGDGTGKKNAHKVLNWSTKARPQALKNQPIQIKLLEKGLSLLKEDGILIYSTCSLNRIENSDVVERVLSPKSSINIEDAKREKVTYEILDFSERSLLKDVPEKNVWRSADEYVKPDCSQRSAEGEDLPKHAPITSRPGLTVLPGKSTGGFYICAIRKRKTKNDCSKSISVPKAESQNSLSSIQLNKESALSHLISKDVWKMLHDVHTCQNRPSTAGRLISAGCPFLESECQILTKSRDVSSCSQKGITRISNQFATFSAEMKVHSNSHDRILLPETFPVVNIGIEDFISNCVLRRGHNGDSLERIESCPLGCFKKYFAPDSIRRLQKNQQKMLTSVFVDVIQKDGDSKTAGEGISGHKVLFRLAGVIHTSSGEEIRSDRTSDDSSCIEDTHLVLLTRPQVLRFLAWTFLK